MRKKLPQVMVTMVVFLFALGTVVEAADKSKGCNQSDIPCWLNKLQSKTWDERYIAMGMLASLPPEQQTSEIKNALIDLLERESKKIQPDGGYKAESSGEGEAEYFYYLCKAVGNTKDPLAIPVLVRIGWLDALEPFGETVLDIIIEKAEEKGRQRFIAAKVLNDFLTPKEKGYTAEGEARQRIRSVLLKAVKDENELVRGTAVLALGNFQDDGVIAVLEDIKNNDPFYRIGKNSKTGEKGIKRYSVRETATEALEKIKKAKGE